MLSWRIVKDLLFDCFLLLELSSSRYSLSNCIKVQVCVPANVLIITRILNNVILSIPFSLIFNGLLENMKSFPASLGCHTSLHFKKIYLNKWLLGVLLYCVINTGAWNQVCVHVNLIWAKALWWRVRVLLNILAVTIDKASKCFHWPKMWGKTCAAVAECWLGIWQSHLFSSFCHQHLSNFAYIILYLACISTYFLCISSLCHSKYGL